MQTTEEQKLQRRHSIPFLYTRGTHYEVGFDVGRTFSGLIHSLLQQAECLPQYLEAYATPKGKKAYDDTLNTLKTNFPQYVRELEGTAEGARVEFHKLFLLHMDNIILSALEKKLSHLPTGCSTIYTNHKDQAFLGHTEDAMAATLNNYYFVSAHIISDQPQGKWGVKEEKFTSLCYAGHLPGYTMSYNHHGLIFSVNTLSAKELKAGKTPRHFIARALLASKDFTECLDILRDSGCGAADGCSFNITFLNQPAVFYNIEMAPVSNKYSNESELDVSRFTAGEHSYHANSYLRLNIEESNEGMTASSVARVDTFNSYPKPNNKEDLKCMLSDQTHCTHPVFRSKNEDFVQTICVGIFDIMNKTWELYADTPKNNEPLVVLPMNIDL